jgi:hypothetical protein
MMEILRFDSSGSTSTNGKKSSKGMLAIGLVATLFGIGSAFASSTITINSSAPIALGQGVTAITACDTSISITPKTSMQVDGSGPKFYLDTITVSSVDTSTTNTSTGLGCQDKFFDLQIFNVADPVAAYTCTELNYLTPRTVAISSGTAPVSCTDSTISFQILGTSSSFEIPFAEVLSDFSYLTLVSRA